MEDIVALASFHRLKTGNMYWKILESKSMACYFTSDLSYLGHTRLYTHIFVVFHVFGVFWWQDDCCAKIVEFDLERFGKLSGDEQASVRSTFASTESTHLVGGLLKISRPLVRAWCTTILQVQTGQRVHGVNLGERARMIQKLI